jgi:hypothetical protein
MLAHRASGSSANVAKFAGSTEKGRLLGELIGE